MLNIYAKYSRVKYNDSRKLLIMMIIINVLQVIINHAKIENMYESRYESCGSWNSWNSISLHLPPPLPPFSNTV